MKPYSLLDNVEITGGWCQCWWAHVRIDDQLFDIDLGFEIFFCEFDRV